MKSIIYFCILTISFTSFTKTAGAAQTSKIIDGVTTFLIDRANQNYLYLFEQRIRDSSLRCYLPQTYGNLEIAGLRELLLSSELWEHTFSKDMQYLLTKTAARELEKGFHFSDNAEKLDEKYQSFLTQFTIVHNGVSHPIIKISNPEDASLKTLIDSFYKEADEIIAAFKYFKQFDNNDSCNTPDISYEDFKKKISALYDLEKKIDLILEVFKKNISNLRLSESGDNVDINEVVSLVKNKITEFKSIYGKVSSILSDLEKLHNEVKDSDIKNTTKFVKIVSTLKKYNVYENNEEFHKIQRYIMFFAQISDETKPETVTAILNAYTTQPVSFFDKRKPESHWLISSKLGVNAFNKTVSADDEDDSFGIFAPIGLEYSRGIGGQDSISIMVAPFDFGHPVSLKLNGIEEDVELDEIIAPSIIISYGFKKAPVELGIGYQFGRKIDQTNQTDEILFLHLSFDMPLWFFR